MTCLRIGSTKTIHSSGFSRLPIFHLSHFDLTLSSYHVKALVPPIPPCMFDLTGTIHLKCKKTMVCLPPPLSVCLFDPLNQTLKCYFRGRFRPLGEDR